MTNNKDVLKDYDVEDEKDEEGNVVKRTLIKKEKKAKDKSE